MTQLITRLNLAHTKTAQRILTIQRLAYRIEADLIDFDGIPQLHESLAELQASSETFLGYHVNKTIAGVLSYEIDDTTLDIGRLVVHPDHFRKGIGRQLVQHVETIPHITKIIVSTGARNKPACNLYESLGYTHTDTREILAGLTIAFYEKIKTN
ncbi:MAG: GNAT family N-acetyltransferase [Chloroflexota bacterium]